MLGGFFYFRDFVNRNKDIKSFHTKKGPLSGARGPLIFKII
jgi:hypothetical protein